MKSYVKLILFSDYVQMMTRAADLLLLDPARLMLEDEGKRKGGGVAWRVHNHARGDETRRGVLKDGEKKKHEDHAFIIRKE